ncbi:MAG: NAD(P)-dependent oxidoreductase [Verrucomicrobia bacterium]|nr:NAD(P)-dependent oxidoreductase [Verrucomicrobiota bacterium]MDA1087346.1 NAD(P)-dependent oxidoreductase [Verrucomicrobiota bacterium]
MQTFQLKFTGDLSDAAGNPTVDCILDRLAQAPHLRHGFLEDQQPKAGDSTYHALKYSMEIGPHHVAKANGIVTCRPWVKASAFAQGAGDLVAIGRAGIGYDKIDLAACTANDVIVFNSPHGLTHSTASAALLFILGLSKRFPLQDRIIREYRWDLQNDAVGDDLEEQTLGIVGLGQSGQELARLIAPFRIRMIAFSPHAEPATAKELGVTLVGSLDELLRESDYVSLHSRLNEQTRGLIGERELSLMKPTAFFINVARGEMVDEHALVRFLREGRIAGAGLDVFETEPLPLGNPLLQLDNVMLTPHWLASTHRALRTTMAPILDGMLRISSGELPDNVLNPDVRDRPGFNDKLQRWRRKDP